MPRLPHARDLRPARDTGNEFEIGNGDRRPASAHSGRSLRDAVWGFLSAEHTCALPDETSVWVEAASTDLKRGPRVYVCLECGMCWHAVADHTKR